VKVLLTNYQLTGYSGTEVVVRDLALELRRQGHETFVYSPRPGVVSESLKAQGVLVVSSLDRLPAAPDIIHGHHHVETMTALLRFPAVPAIYVCHDAASAYDQPFDFPRILRYVAVDHRCRGRIEKVSGIPRAHIRIMLNAVDLARFQQRRELPSSPEQALVFSNRASRYTHLPAVQEACRQTGLKLDVLGAEAGTLTPTPESVLPSYDLVFAKARCALEAMAAGNAVVLCDFSGAGQMVTTENFDRLRLMNFGQGVLLDPLRPANLVREIQRYNATDAAAVTRRVRDEAGLESAARQWIALYAEVIEEWKAMKPDVAAEQASASTHLRAWIRDQRSLRRRERIVQFVRGIPLAGDFLYHQALKVRRWIKRKK
jgi:glycosyltransferase involved in cell wall biosynthesis